MARYKIWNKTDDIYTPSGQKFTASQWMSRYTWAAIPGVKMLITDGVINGGVAIELGQCVAALNERGAQIAIDGLTDDEICAAIESAEDALNAPDNTPSTDERIAAALEAQNLMSMPDVE